MFVVKERYFRIEDKKEYEISAESFNTRKEAEDCVREREEFDYWQAWDDDWDDLESDDDYCEDDFEYDDMFLGYSIAEC